MTARQWEQKILTSAAAPVTIAVVSAFLRITSLHPSSQTNNRLVRRVHALLTRTLTSETNLFNW